MGHLNVFQFCTGLRIIGSFMILVVLGIVALSYNAVVISSYGPDLTAGGWRTAIAAIVLVLFHSLLAMLLWSYFATVLSDPGGVPGDWSPYMDTFDVEAAEMTASPLGGKAGPGKNALEDEAKAALMSGTGEGCDEKDSVAGPAGQAGRGSEGIMPAGGSDSGSILRRDPASEMIEVRRCKKCLHYKPPRTHHCSVCSYDGLCGFLLLLVVLVGRRCILKMDHHCVWVVNCVGARNYKSFILFMVYTCLESTLVSISLLPRFVEFFGEGDVGPEETVRLLSIFMAFILNCAFMLSLMGFLALHVSLVLANTTTIEAFEKAKAGSKWRYDMGRQRNIEQVFGRDKRYWLLPCYSPEDLKSMPELSGLHYPCKSENERPASQQLTSAHALDLD